MNRRVPSARAPVNLAPARRGRQLDAAPLRVGCGSIEHGDVSDEARDGAARLFRDRARDLAALVALARDPDLHELVIAERAIERRDHARRDAGRADLHHGIERVREAAQMPAIAAGELDRCGRRGLACEGRSIAAAG